MQLGRAGLCSVQSLADEPRPASPFKCITGNSIFTPDKSISTGLNSEEREAIAGPGSWRGESYRGWLGRLGKGEHVCVFKCGESEFQNVNFLRQSGRRGSRLILGSKEWRVLSESVLPLAPPCEVPCLSAAFLANVPRCHPQQFQTLCTYSQSAWKGSRQLWKQRCLRTNN